MACYRVIIEHLKEKLGGAFMEFVKSYGIVKRIIKFFVSCFNGPQNKESAFAQSDTQM